MTNYVKSIFLGLLISLVVGTSALAEKVNVTFITVGDIEDIAGNKRGGMARLASVVKDEKEKNENAVYILAGDFISPSLIATFDQGEHMIDLLNMNPPDILVPGNHEFDFGQKVFEIRMKDAESTKLATNARLNGEKLEGFYDTKILEFNGVKIGFMGLITDTTPDISQPENIKFLDPLETAKKTSEKLKDQGVDMVVVVTHTSTNVDFKLLYQEGIDLVISGHDHVLHTFYDGKSVLVEAKESAEYVVMTDVEFDVAENNGKRKVNWHPNFRIVDTKDVKQDRETAKKVKYYESQLSEKLSETIGTAKIEISTLRSQVRVQENIFGNITADAMRKIAKTDVALMNGGGIRGNQIYKAGHKFTLREMYEEFPFGNLNVKIEITGETLMKTLEHSVSTLPEAAGQFLHGSNITFDVDINKNIGSRVSNVKIGGEKIDLNKRYTVAVPDFIANGGGKYDMLENAKVLGKANETTLVVEDVIKYIKEKRKVTGKLEGRINIK